MLCDCYVATGWMHLEELLAFAPTFSSDYLVLIEPGLYHFRSSITLGKHVQKMALVLYVYCRSHL